MFIVQKAGGETVKEYFFWGEWGVNMLHDYLKSRSLWGSHEQCIMSSWNAVLPCLHLKNSFAFPLQISFCPTPQRSPYRPFSPLQLIMFLPFFNLLNLTGVIYLSAILLKLHKVFLFSFWCFHSPAFSFGWFAFYFTCLCASGVSTLPLLQD